MAGAVMDKEILLAQTRQTMQLFYEATKAKNSLLMQYYLGKIDSYREVLWSMGMSHDEIEFQLSLNP